MMSDFKMDSDGTYQWVVKGGETLFTDDCAATMNQQAETIQQLKARIARLEEPYSRYGENGETDVGILLFYEQVVNEASKQSLAEIQADAVDAAIEYAGEFSKWPDDYIGLIHKYADQLRKGGE